MHSGDALVEDHGVGDDGAGHAAGLGHVVHAQQGGNLGGDGGAEGVHFLEDVGGVVDTLLKEVGSTVNGVLGHGDEADKVGQVGDGAVEPAGLGEADGRVAFHVEDAPG